MTSSRQIYNRKLDEARRYWLRKLSPDDEVTGFPIPSSHSANAEDQWQSIDLALPPVLCNRINALTEGSPFLLYVVAVAAVKMCFQKYTGANLISVGSPCRSDMGSGNKQTLLPIIDRIDREMTVRECLGSVRENLLEAYRHQDYSVELLLRELKRPDSLFESPLTSFAIAFDEIHQASDQPSCDILLKLFRGANEIGGEIRLSPRAANRALVEQFTCHLVTLLQAALENTGAKIADLPIMSRRERSRLIEFSGLADAQRTDKTIHALFSSQALENPEAVALICQEQSLSYRELNERANQMAHHLRSLGVRSESLVAVCLERSAELIVSLLGVLKAGGAYIPLDPGNPAARLVTMLEDASPAVLITRKNLLGASVPATTRIIEMDEDIHLIEKQPASDPGVGVELQNLAYCIYTSGSTGSPKAVGVTHLAIAARAVTMCRLYGIGPLDRMLQFVSPAFDAFGEELFPILIRGGSIVVSHQDPSTLSPGALLSLAAREQVTILHFVAGYWLHLVKYLSESDQGLPTSVKLTIVGGEPMPTEASAEWLRRGPSQSRLFNAYGPTEATITATRYEYTNEAAGRLNWVPIGHPLSNSSVYVVDHEGQLGPVGLPGKLHIGGSCLARGYLHQPDLTSERFIPDPFSGVDGSRMYYTGDFARWLPDGSLEYLGRDDRQVKIRGYRIELGEIEAMLLAHPAVDQCAVNVFEDGNVNKRLVAYVVMREPATTVEALRAWMQERAPNFMVPSNFVPLECLPVNSNGKIDRRSLPSPEGNALNRSYVAPTTAAEKVLAEIWAQVLGLDRVSVRDNFFELGGDSIISIQVTARANQAGLRFSTQDIFKHQTIAELASAASDQEPSKAEQGIVNGSVPLTPIQHWFFERNLITPHHFNQSVLLQAKRRLNPSLLEQSFDMLLLHHDALRLRFSLQGGKWYQNNSDVELNRVFSFVDLGSPRADKLAALEGAAAESQSSLDLQAGPLMRAVLFDLGESEPNRLLIVIHHLAVDGVSWRILLDDLQTVYEQLEGGIPLALPPKSASFRQWAEHLQAFAQSPSLQAERKHWASIQSRDVSLLPIDHMTGANDYASEAVAVAELTVEETERLLRHRARARQANVDEILLAAVLRALTSWSGQHCLLVDVEGHGREELFDGVEIGRTVGWFTNLHPVWLGAHEPEASDHLRVVAENLRQIPNRGVGYGLLRYLRDEQSANEQMEMNPRAEVVFNYLGQFDNLFSHNALFERSWESTGPAINRVERRPYLFEINSHISGGRLHVRWSYSRNLHLPETVERLAKHLLSSIRDLIYLDESPLAVSLHTNDLLNGELTPEELNSILEEVNVEGA
ncbi:MAG: amino acid adenylation domain-containing protein [Blastocatellia bacterium]